MINAQFSPQSCVRQRAKQLPPLSAWLCRLMLTCNTVLCCAVLWLHVPSPPLQGWKLHVWGDVKEAPAWGRGLEPTGFDDGPFWVLKLKPGANHVGCLVYKGDSTQGEEKAAGE